MLPPQDPTPRGNVSPQVSQRVRRVPVVRLVRMPCTVHIIWQAEAAAHGIQEQDHRRKWRQQYRYENISEIQPIFRPTVAKGLISVLGQFFSFLARV